MLLAMVLAVPSSPLSSSPNSVWPRMTTSDTPLMFISYRMQFIFEEFKKGTFETKWIKGPTNVADVLTKTDPAWIHFNLMRDAIMVRGNEFPSFSPPPPPSLPSLPPSLLLSQIPPPLPLQPPPHPLSSQTSQNLRPSPIYSPHLPPLQDRQGLDEDNWKGIYLKGLHSFSDKVRYLSEQSKEMKTRAENKLYK